MDLSGLRPDNGICLLQEMIRDGQVVLEGDGLEMKLEPCGMRTYRIEPQ
jgi:hypothetical protein